MKSVIGLLLASLLCVSACAGGAVPETALKVDLDTVRATGDVMPVDGITASGQPDAATLEVFADNGYRAVIDLRTGSENRGYDEPAAVKELGMSYIALPISSGDISFENAAKLDEAISRFDGPVLVHCASSNRVGALLALRESARGRSDDDAIEYGRKAGLTSLEPAVREALAGKGGD